MQLYTFIDTDNIVVQVIEGRAADEIINGISDWEAHYAESFGLPCKRVNMLKDENYPSIGYSYNEAEDIFIAPQPYPSWIRVGSFWQAPTPYPTDGLMYQWVEADLNWQLIPTE